MTGRILRGPAVVAALAFGAAAIGQAESGRWAGTWMEEEEFAEVEDAVDGAEVEELEQADDAVRPDVGVPDFDVRPIFADAPEDFLVDAGELLSPEVAAERLEFLRHHAEDSVIALYVYVLDPTWRVPVDVDPGRFFSGMDAAVVFYTMGEPPLAGLYLPAHLAEQISDAEQRRALQSSVMQAVAKVDAEEQLEAFLVQMSIRLYWMERMMADTVPMVETPEIPPPPMDAAAETESPEFPAPDAWWPWIAVGVFMIASPIAWWALHMRARFRFPEIAVEPRLGGRHAAGVGAVISYLSPNVPPARQRDQVPEYPRRM